MSAPPRWHLAQLNIGRVRAPMTDPLMAGFVAELESVQRMRPILHKPLASFVFRSRDKHYAFADRREAACAKPRPA
jgi:hypothetical protein